MSKELDALIKQFGKGAFLSGDQITSKTLEIVSFSPTFDVILGGGVPRGSVVRLSGPPKCGKTVSALCLARNALKADKRTHIYYMDIEHRLKPRDIKGIHGLDTKRITVTRSYKDEKTGETHIFSAEDFLRSAEHILHHCPYCIIVLDSVSQVVTEDERTAEITEQKRAPGAVLVARFCKRMTGIISVNNAIIISITHEVANTSGFGSNKSETGGTKIKYISDVALHAKSIEAWKVGDEQIGQKVAWQSTSAAIAPPGRKMTSWIRYGYGVDDLTELIELGCSLGIIENEKKSAWYYITYKGERNSYHGKAKLFDAINTDKELHTFLNNGIQDMLR